MAGSTWCYDWFFGGLVAVVVEELVDMAIDDFGFGLGAGGHIRYNLY